MEGMEGDEARRLVSEKAPLLLSYERRGRGEPLLLIHGAGSDWRVWEPVMDLLASEREVIAVDLPGHGDSLRSWRRGCHRRLGASPA